MSSSAPTESAPQKPTPMAAPAAQQASTPVASPPPADPVPTQSSTQQVAPAAPPAFPVSSPPAEAVPETPTETTTQQAVSPAPAPVAASPSVACEGSAKESQQPSSSQPEPAAPSNVHTASKTEVPSTEPTQSQPSDPPPVPAASNAPTESPSTGSQPTPTPAASHPVPIPENAPAAGSPGGSPLPSSPSSLPKGRPMLSRRARTLSHGSVDGTEFEDIPTRVRSFSAASVAWGRHVILALDSSDNAKHAFDWFMENIYKQDDMIVLVHCPEAPRLPTFTFKSGFAPPVHEWKKILDEMNERTRRLEEDYEATCIHRKLRYKIRGEAMKSAGEGIIKIAESENAEMIVIGNRGMSTVKRALLGSVSDYVVRNSHLPVVIVPKQKK